MCNGVSEGLEKFNCGISRLGGIFWSGFKKIIVNECVGMTNNCCKIGILWREPGV